MIEVTLFNYLKSELSDPVFMQIPKTMPEKFYVIEKTGGGMNEHISTAIFAIQAYAGSMYEAATMIETLKNVMFYNPGFNTENEVCKVTLNSSYNYTDQSQKKYRYQAVYEIIHY